MNKPDKPENEKKRAGYYLMVFADSQKTGHVRQMGFSGTFVNIVIVILAAIIIISVTGFSVNHKKVEELSYELVEKDAIIASLQGEKTDLVDIREELTEKVTILSDTINQKVEEEEALAEEDAKAHMPQMFPVSSSAQIEQKEDEEKLIELTCSEGSAVVASGAGTVVSVTTDTGYSYSVKVNHGNGYVSTYRNDGDVMVREGDEVVGGAIIYVIGEDNTKLGYQIQYDEKYIDPMELISIDG